MAMAVCQKPCTYADLASGIPHITGIQNAPNFLRVFVKSGRKFFSYVQKWFGLLLGGVLSS